MVWTYVPVWDSVMRNGRLRRRQCIWMERAQSSAFEESWREKFVDRGFVSFLVIVLWSPNRVGQTPRPRHPSVVRPLPPQPGPSPVVRRHLHPSQVHCHLFPSSRNPGQRLSILGISEVRTVHGSVNSARFNVLTQREQATRRPHRHRGGVIARHFIYPRRAGLIDMYQRSPASGVTRGQLRSMVDRAIGGGMSTADTPYSTEYACSRSIA